MSSLNKIYHFLMKDIQVEARRGFEVLASIGFISAASLILAEVAVKSFTPQFVIPGLWIIVVFIAIFTATTTFVREMDKRTIYGVRLLPVSPSIIFLSKMMFSFILILLQGGVSLFIIAVFSGQLYMLSVNVIFVLIVLALHVSAIASFTSALVMYSEGRAFLIPMLVFILTIPVIPLATTISDPAIPSYMTEYVMFLGQVAVTLIVMTILSEYILKS